jgi:hypothetical protein
MTASATLVMKKLQCIVFSHGKVCKRAAIAISGQPFIFETKCHGQALQGVFPAGLMSRLDRGGIQLIRLENKRVKLAILASAAMA